MSLENRSITELKGIGDKRAQAFKRLGVSSLYDLVSFYPVRYEDRSVFKKLSEVSDGESVSVLATVAADPVLNRIRRGMELVKFRIVDETGVADVTYFNQAYMKNSFRRGDVCAFYGKFSVKGRFVSIANPAFEKNADASSGAIVPVYRLSSGLNRKAVTDAIRSCLTLYGNLIEDPVPEKIREKYRLIPEYDAVRSIHFPDDFDALRAARRRLIFDELFIFSLAVGRFKNSNTEKTGRIIRPASKELLSSLPFSPTGAQSRAIEQCEADMASGKMMSRLIQGDVGSGKTLVAAAAIFSTFRSGLCSAYMAPTEILAKQHYSTFSELFAPFGMRTELLTGSTGAKERKRILSLLAAGELDLVVGTHALFSADVEYGNLGLVVTDEQHRFGVGQRSSLIEKAESPHVLVMSATPIPRTLALILYGDLDVSVIDELPPGRQRVDTFAVDSSYRQRLNGFIRKQVGEGGQVFIVCPKVEEDEEDAESGLKSAVDYAKELSEEMPEIKIGCVHGRLPAAEKNAVMESFAAGETQVLAATTVIEVGVDVPNASLMVIEDAERFGLSQLHQLRGRVGRGSRKSYCILVSDAEGENAKARLKILCDTNDGFKIAEEDLRLRGPGDFFGSRQHGLPEMHIADLAADMELLQDAHDEAGRLLDEDPELAEAEHLLLKKKTDSFYSEKMSSFN